MANIPHKRSPFDDTALNIDNTVINAVNEMKNRMLNLTANGHLTPQQFTQMITVLNGLVKKGDMTINEINWNFGKIGQHHLSEDLIKIITGKTAINSTPADGSVTTIKMAGRAITPDKTSFFAGSDNLFKGEYRDGLLVKNGNGARLHPTNNYESWEGKTAVISVAPNTTYSVFVDPGESNVFRVGLAESNVPFRNYPSNSQLSRVIYSGDAGISTSSVSVRTGDNETYLFVYVSNEGKTPALSVLESLIDKNYIPELSRGEVTPEKTSFFGDNDNIFDGKYQDGLLFRTGNGSYLVPTKNYDNWKGKTAVIKVEPNTTYHVAVEPSQSNVFRVGLHPTEIGFGDYPAEATLSRQIHSGQEGDGVSEVTFRTKSDDHYLYVYISNNGTNAHLNVSEMMLQEEFMPPIKERAITPDKTSFFTFNDKNAFDGNYYDGLLFYAQRSDIGDTLYLRNSYDNIKGRTAVVPVKPNTTYAAKVHDTMTSDVFRVGLTNGPPVFVDDNTLSNTVDTFITEQRTNTKEIVFTTEAETQYALIYVSNDGQQPSLMVEEGDTFGPFVGRAVIPNSYLENGSAGVSEIQKDAKFNIAGDFTSYISQAPLEDYWSNPTTLTPAAFHNRFKQLTDAHPEIAKATRLGTDDFGYELYKYEIKPAQYYKGTYWNQNPGDEGQRLSNPKIIVTGGVHGREKNVSYAMYYLFKELLENPNNNDTLDAIKTNVHLIFMPIASPSGFVDVTYENRDGMNINRDFPPYGKVEQGETKLIKKVIDDNKDMDFFIDYHNMQARHNLIGYSLTDDPFFQRATLNVYRSVGRHWQQKESGFPQGINHRWAYTVASNEGTVGRYVKDVLNIPSTLIEIPLKSQWIDEGLHGAKNTQMAVDILLNTILSCIRSKQ